MLILMLIAALCVSPWGVAQAENGQALFAVADESGDAGSATADEQTPDDEVVHLLDRIIVTTKKFESPLLKNPHAVTIVSSNEINQSGSLTAGDLLRGKPGLAVQSDGSWGANPTIRCLSKEQVIVMIDGVRINSAQPWGAIASLADLSFYDRVEVVKGPTSLLYGSGALGGVVNFISRQGQFTENLEVSGRLSSGGSSINEGYLGSGCLMVTSPRHAVELSATRSRFKNYDAPGGEVLRTGYDQWSGGGRYRLNLGASHVLGLAFQHHKAEDVWYPGSARPHPVPVVGTTIIHSPDQERTLFRADHEVLFGESRLETTLYRQKVDRTMFAFSEKLNKDFMRNTVPFTTMGGESRFDFSPLENQCFSVGLSYWRMEGDPESQQYQPPFSNNIVLVKPFEEGVVQSAGAYVQDDITLDSWTVKLGVRLDKVTGDASKAGAGPAAITEGLKHTDNTFSWSGGAVYHHSESINPYVNVAQGYRAADMRERFEKVARGDGFLHIGDPELNPENNVTVDAGIRGEVNDVYYSLSAYSSWIRDYIAGRDIDSTDPMSGMSIKQTENLAKVEIRGVEVEFDYSFANDMHTYLLGSYQRGQNKYDNEPLYQVPPAEVTLGLAYCPKLQWHADVRWRLVDAQNRVAVRFSNNTENSTAGFGTVDIRGGYRFSDLYEVHLGVTNLFDNEYHEHLTEGISNQEIKAPGIGAYVGTTVGF